MREGLRASVGGALVVASVLLVSHRPAESMPCLMDLFNEHPLSLKQHHDKCVVCHVRADGSGPLTGFGERYDREGLELTSELIATYPNLFQTGAASALSEVASAETPRSEVPAPAAEPSFDAARYYRAECKKCHGKRGDGDPFQGVPAFATKRWLAERSPNTEELLQIILKGKDKMIGHEGKITEVQAAELLGLIRTIAEANS